MFLEIDMGNTRVKWRLRNDSYVVMRGALDTGSGFDTMEEFLRAHRVHVRAVWVASVVGDDLEKKLSTWVEIFFSLKPVFARSCEAVGNVINGYESPGRLGVDRWLASIAAYRLVGDACVVVSCGTALTVDLLSGDGKHRGGYIAPGINLVLSSIDSAARLISVEKDQFLMNLSPGKTTGDAVFGGLSAMVHGLIENAIKQLSLQGEKRIELIITGGDANKLLPLYPNARIVPDLVLDGLVYDMGCSSLVE